MLFRVFLTNHDRYLDGDFSDIHEAVIAGRKTGFEYQVRGDSGNLLISGDVFGGKRFWPAYYREVAAGERYLACR